MNQSSSWKKWGWVGVAVVLHAVILSLATLMPANRVDTSNPLAKVEILEMTEEQAAHEPPPPALPPEPIRPTTSQAAAPQPAVAAVNETSPSPVAPVEPTQGLPVPTRVRDRLAVEPDSSDIADEPEHELKAAPLATEKTAQLEATASALAGPSDGHPDPAPRPKAVEAPAALPLAKTGQVKNADQLKPAAPNQAPLFPDSDRLEGREGLVRIRFYVSADGAVSQGQIMNNTGSEQMGKNALAAIKGYRYQPEQTGWWEKDFNFSFNGEEPEETGGQLRR